MVMNLRAIAVDRAVGISEFYHKQGRRGAITLRANFGLQPGGNEKSEETAAARGSNARDTRSSAVRDRPRLSAEIHSLIGAISSKYGTRRDFISARDRTVFGRAHTSSGRKRDRQKFEYQN